MLLPSASSILNQTNHNLLSRLKNLWHKIPVFPVNYAVALVIGFGALLRLIQYLANDSLFVDEGALALNIINRSFAGLLRPLDYEQGAPIGFLLIERLLVLLFGTSEYALRLFPFLASIVSLILFQRLAQFCLGVTGSLLALFFFAVCEPLIQYAAQVKQYSSDVAFTLLILLVALDQQTKGLTPRRTAFLSLFGAILLWFSHPAAFILAGVGTMLFLRDLLRKRYARLKSLLVVGISWGISFALFYFLSLRSLADSEYLGAFWNKGRARAFMPLPPTSLADLSWFSKTFFRLFYNPVGSPDPTLAGLIFLLGCLAFLLTKKKMMLALLASPLLFGLLASGLRLYPFVKRLMLWAVPTLLIFLAAGLYQVFTFKSPYTLPLGLVLLWLLLVPTFRAAIDHARHPSDDSGLREAVAYVKSNQGEGDVIYSHYKQKEAFEYYALRYHLRHEDYAAGAYPEEDSDEGLLRSYKKVIEQFQMRKRLWGVFTYIRSRESFKDDELFDGLMKQTTNRLAVSEFQKTSVSLYTLPGR